MQPINCQHMKAGDVVTRIMGGEDGVPMRLKVTEVSDSFVYCGPPGIGWKFSRVTGAEIDEELGWDRFNSGSFLDGTVNAN